MLLSLSLKLRKGSVMGLEPSPPRHRSVLLALALAATLPACAGHLREGVYSQGSVRFRIGLVAPTWQLLSLAGNDVAYISRDSPHALAVNATCEDHDDPPLDVLTRHLLMGFSDRQTLSQSRSMLDGREALRTHVSAKLDGVPVELLLVVLKKDGCVYDFTYLSPAGRLEERVAAFEQILASFKTGASS
jgi:hypothetical protein